MIKLIKKINATYFKTYNDFLFVLENDNSPLFIYDLNSFELIKKVGGNYGGGLYIVKNYVIDESFKGININTLLEKIFFEEEDIYYYIKNNKYAVIRKFIEGFEVEFYLLEIEKNKILQKINFEGEIALLNELGVVISYTNDTLYKYSDYKYSDFSLLWQKDLSEITQYTQWDNSEVKGEIREVYSYKDTLIVLTQVFVLRINIQTGEIIYSLRLPAGVMTLSIEGGKAYGCYGYHYMEIDLEKGELINFVRIEDAIYEEKRYNAIMNKATFHNGHVFHGLRFEGGQYAVGAIDTKTGNREWMSLLSVYMVEKIQFHQDKIFISDTGGNLFIYEMIK